MKRLVGLEKVSLDSGVAKVVEIPLDLAMLDVRLDGTWVTKDLQITYAIGFEAQTSQPINRERPMTTDPTR